MDLLFLANKKFAIGVVLSQLGIVAAFLYLLFLRKKYPAPARVLGKHGLELAFFVSLASMAGSLFYSQVAGFAPCDLCWIQRICMYPLILLTAMGVLKKDKHVADYVLGLSIIGAFISLYHNFIYYYNGGLNVFCNIGGAGVSCVKRYVFEFGYVTIPMMALTAFLVIIVLMIFVKLYQRNT